MPSFAVERPLHSSHTATALRPDGGTASVAGGEPMTHTVKIVLSPEEWNEAVRASAIAIAPYCDKVESLPSETLAELLRTVMMTALWRHHAWLAAQMIGAVISAEETSERSYLFRFQSEQDARRFQAAFGGNVVATPVQ
ncbi:conserved protein of unknown function [Rhodovastum atsumiense]|uniref:Uncharacterized protein n=1 Tax=Rhodovastum atsumiense TaxID=504468 RepID=A0A5M6INP6_9PROT|nr:hypothetical protein [Rhodovastum atsumiense]KAA5609893.1 hypothetical protein F1189_22155 [Rhodovastum atsumiense]CAH2602401.1 conserved protein of unknown function [Rhodovastum atsumiense]